MTSPQDPRKDPLKDDEVALARVMRALPGGEPSPQVDAAILAAARNATATSPSRAHRRRGLPAWALGTAAAAVLAVGIGLQLQPQRDALPDGVTAQAPATATDAKPGQVEDTESRLKRTGIEAAGQVEPQAKPVPSPRFVEPAAPAAVVALPPPAPPAAPPVPTPPPAEPVHDAEAAAARAVADDALSREDAASSGRERERTEAARRQARAAPTVAESAPMQEMLDSAGEPPTAFSADDVLPPVADDGQLSPEAWLERIRDRIRQGDRAGARASLQRFERAHPDITLPPDLAAFRP